MEYYRPIPFQVLEIWGLLEEEQDNYIFCPKCYAVWEVHLKSVCDCDQSKFMYVSELSPSFFPKMPIENHSLTDEECCSHGR